MSRRRKTIVCLFLSRFREAKMPSRPTYPASWNRQEGRHPQYKNIPQVGITSIIGPDNVSQQITEEGVHKLAHDQGAQDTHYGGNDVSRGQTNITINLQYFIILFKRRKHQTGYHQFCMIERSIDCHNPGNIQPPYNIIAISYLNYLLELGVDRQEFKHEISADKILRKWKALGVLHREPEDDSSTQSQRSLAELYHIQCETNMFNDWITLEKRSRRVNGTLNKCQYGDALFYVLVRVKAKPPLVEYGHDMDIDENGSGDSYDHIPTREEREADDEKRYWKFVPMKYPGGTMEPNYWDYNSSTTDFNSLDYFQGGFIYVGFITKFANRHGPKSSAAAIATESMYPKQDNGDYKLAKMKLPELIVQLFKH